MSACDREEGVRGNGEKQAARQRMAKRWREGGGGRRSALYYMAMSALINA